MSLEPVWIVVADGGAARFFYRPKAGVPLLEMEVLGDVAAPAARKRAKARHEHIVTSHGRNSPDQELAEKAFLKEVAREIDQAVQKNAVGQLAVCAAPRALGVLRNEMSTAARRHLVCEIAKDFVHEPVDEIDAHMREHML